MSFRNSQETLRKGKISLTSLLDEKRSMPLYIINTSDLNNTQPRGELYITIRNGDRDQIIKIPNTWIPIDLSAYAAREAILNSPEFRQALQRGRMEAINSKVAEEVLATESAQEEKSLLSIKENYTDPDAQASAIERAGLDNPVAQSNAARQLATGQGTLEGVQPQVVGLVTREGITDRDMVTGLRNLGNMTEKDYHYVMSQINTNEMPRVAAFVRESLQMKPA